MAICQGGAAGSGIATPSFEPLITYYILRTFEVG